MGTYWAKDGKILWSLSSSKVSGKIGYKFHPYKGKQTL